MKNDLLTASARRVFEKLEWPGPEDEEWRRTDLRRLLPKGLLDAAAARADGAASGSPEDDAERNAPLLADDCAARIITEGGRPVAMAVSEESYRAGLSVSWAEPEDLPERLVNLGRVILDGSTDRVRVWHWRDMPGSLIVSLSPGARLKGPVLIEEQVAGSSLSAGETSLPHLHVEASESSDLSLLWSFTGDPGPGGDATPILNAGLTVLSGANARTSVAIRQNLGNRVVCFLGARIDIQRDGSVHFFESHLGGCLVKTRAQAVLSGEGADARLQGVYVGEEGRHLDIGTRQEHQTPRTTSDALYKGAVRPGGRSVFQGLIDVAPKAAKTDAYLTNKNLVLGDGARADSLPQLNILTDDVKCSHGSTTGKLDEIQLFYLQSRGYSPAEAQKELVRGFLAEAVDAAPKSFTDILIQDLDIALSGS